MQSTNVVIHSHRYKDFQGNLYYNGSTASGNTPIYAAAYMVQSSPSMICPYYNDTAAYRSSTGLGYYIACGALYYTGTDISTTQTTSKSHALSGRGKLEIIRNVLTSASRVVTSKRTVKQTRVAANNVVTANKTLITVLESCGRIPRTQPNLPVVYKLRATAI
jgi:hypothetical protein